MATAYSHRIGRLRAVLAAGIPIVSDTEFAALVGVTPPHFWKLAAKPGFPVVLKIRGKRPCWRQDEAQAFAAAYDGPKDVGVARRAQRLDRAAKKAAGRREPAGRPRGVARLRGPQDRA
jgi:hypothetical protein